MYYVLSFKFRRHFFKGSINRSPESTWKKRCVYVLHFQLLSYEILNNYVQFIISYCYYHETMIYTLNKRPFLDRLQQISWQIIKQKNLNGYCPRQLIFNRLPLLIVHFSIDSFRTKRARAESANHNANAKRLEPIGKQWQGICKMRGKFT